MRRGPVLVLVAFAAALLATGSVGARADDDLLPADVEAYLASFHSIDVAAPGATQARVTADHALEVAATESSFVWSEPRDVETYLLRFTAHGYGTAADDDEEVTPIYVGKLAWLVVMRDVDVPLFGPPERDHPPTYRTTVVHFIDAADGTWLFAAA